MEDREKLRMSDKIVDLMEKEIKQEIHEKDEKIKELNKEVQSMRAKMTEQYAYFQQ